MVWMRYRSVILRSGNTKFIHNSRASASFRHVAGFLVASPKILWLKCGVSMCIVLNGSKGTNCSSWRKYHWTFWYLRHLETWTLKSKNWAKTRTWALRGMKQHSPHHYTSHTRLRLLNLTQSFAEQITWKTLMFGSLVRKLYWPSILAQVILAPVSGLILSYQRHLEGKWPGITKRALTIGSNYNNEFLILDFPSFWSLSLVINQGLHVLIDLVYNWGLIDPKMVYY